MKMNRELKKSNNRINDYYNKFIIFETSYGLLESPDYGYIWEGVRFNVFEELLNNENLFKNSHDVVEINNLELKTKFKICRNVIFSFIGLSSLKIHKKKICYLFFSSGRRKIDDQGMSWDVYIDPLVTFIENNYPYMILELPYQALHNNNPRSKNIIYTDYLNFINKTKIKIESDIVNYFTKLENQFSVDFGISVNILKIVKSFLKNYQNSKKNYYKLFKRIKPNAILIDGSYGKEALINAAKNLRIPIIELQHGIVSDLHLGYNFPMKKNFPDYFFSFGPAWGKMAHFPIRQERIIPIGYQYLNTALSKLKSVAKRDQILFLSQGTIGDRLSEFAVDLLFYIPPDVKILFKLHPGEYLRWKTEYTTLYSASEKGLIKVIADDEPSLFQLMAECKWQVGVYSTALFEGMAFNCKTFVLDLPGVEYVDRLTSSHKFILVQDPNQIELSYNAEELNYRAEEYFSQNTENRFKAAIDFVMKDYNR